MNLLETVDLLINLAQCSALVQRQAHDAALLGDGLQDALANPPYGIGDEFESARFVEFLSSFYQSDVSFVNQVRQCQTLMLVLLSYRDDETEVGCHQTLLGLLALRSTLADSLRQFNLFINGHKGLTTDFYKVLVKCLT